MSSRTLERLNNKPEEDFYLIGRSGEMSHS